MRLEGERPSHAVYEMLIRGCTIAMQRPGIGEQPDHLTGARVSDWTGERQEEGGRRRRGDACKASPE